MKKLLSVLIAILGGLSAFQVYDPGFLALLQQKLEDYNQKLPQEKLYIQTDKPFYQPDETVWFQAYVLDGLAHTPTPTSGVLYVDLINPKGSVEKQLHLPIIKGRAHGDLLLDASLPGGLYKLRAYTLWMKNFGEDFYFEKQLQVQKVLTPRLLFKLDFERKSYGPGQEVVANVQVRDLEDRPLQKNLDWVVQLAGRELTRGQTPTDAQGKAQVRFGLPPDLATADGLLNVVVQHEGKTESIARAVPIVLQKIDLQFFPEGGDWVAGVPTGMAYKAIDEFGKPAEVEGEIVDQNGNLVQRFKSFHQGMGRVELTARPNTTYRARLVQPAIGRWYELPKILPEGLALKAQLEAQKIALQVYSPTVQTLYVVAQVRGKLLFGQELAAQPGQNALDIPTGDFPAGIAQITLFDPLRAPRCERLVFVNPAKTLRVQLETDKRQYRPREQVRLKVRATDALGQPVQAALSVAVVDDQLVAFADDKQDNILSQFLLSSDLKGKVHEPHFYFKPDEPKAGPALDLVMLTHGWRRFAWSEVLGGEPLGRGYFAEKNGTVRGRVVHAGTGAPVQATVTLAGHGRARPGHRDPGRTGRPGPLGPAPDRGRRPVCVHRRRPGQPGAYFCRVGPHPGQKPAHPDRYVPFRAKFPRPGPSPGQPGARPEGF